MHGHKLQRVRAGQRLMLAGLERRMRQKSRQFVRLARRRVLDRWLRVALGDECRGGIDQFTQVFQTIGAFFFRPVMRLKAACLDDMPDDFR